MTSTTMLIRWSPALSRSESTKPSWPSEANDMACGEETVYLGARSGWRSVGKPWALPRRRERGSKPDVDRWSRPDMRDVTMVFPCFEMDRVLHFLVPVKALFFFSFFFFTFLLSCSIRTLVFSSGQTPEVRWWERTVTNARPAVGQGSTGSDGNGSGTWTSTTSTHMQ